MKQHEITYGSANSESYAKPITALVYRPDEPDAGTGAMLFSHGWGGNRFQHADKMAHAVDRYNLVCVSVEYRMSGFDFNPVTGLGASRPYDASFLQVVDVLNGLREVLAHYPGIDRKRIFHYGGSQGGHIALISAVYAPRTFAGVYAASPATHMSEKIRGWTGRDLSPSECAARDATLHADRIGCPVFLEHGTADETVECDLHTRAFEARLRELGKTVDARYHEGGGHQLEPVTTRLASFIERFPHLLRMAREVEKDDFAVGGVVRLACADRALVVDWSLPSDDYSLLRWE